MAKNPPPLDTSGLFEQVTELINSKVREFFFGPEWEYDGFTVDLRQLLSRDNPYDDLLVKLAQHLVAYYRACEYDVEFQPTNMILKIMKGSSEIVPARLLPNQEKEPEQAPLKRVKEILDWKSRPSLSFLIDYDDGTAPTWQPFGDVCEWSEVDGDWSVTEQLLEFLSREPEASRIVNEATEALKPGHPLVSLPIRSPGPGCDHRATKDSPKCGNRRTVRWKTKNICSTHLCAGCNRRMVHFATGLCRKCRPNRHLKRPRSVDGNSEHRAKKVRIE